MGFMALYFYTQGGREKEEEEGVYDLLETIISKNSSLFSADFRNFPIEMFKTIKFSCKAFYIPFLSKRNTSK